ncbi:MAG: hypothetical protein RLZZ303_807 [Candidatus Hydrogenedentota bacterium]
MLDDQNDKQMQRNQLIAMTIMLVFIGVWSYFFMPRPQPVPPADPAAAEQQAAQTPAADGAATAVTPPPSSPTPGGDAAATATPGQLPPVAETAEPGDEVVLLNGALELTFTRVGSRLKQARVVLGDNGVDSVDLIPDASLLPPSQAEYPLGLRFAGNYLGDALNLRRWDAAPGEDGRSVTFSITIPGEARIEKQFSMDEALHVLRTKVRYTNLGSAPRLLGLDTKEAAMALTWGPQMDAADAANSMMPQKIVWHVDGLNERTATADLTPPTGSSLYTERRTNAEWAAIRTAYFVMAMKPEFDGADFWVRGMPEAMTLGCGFPRTEVPAGATLEGEYTLYLGPNQQSFLAEAWPSLSSVIEFFEWFSIMDSFAKFLLTMLNWMHNNIFANYGVAIILLTIVVRLVVFPLTWKSMISMKKMQKLAPEMEKLKEEYKDNPEEFQKKMMAFYQERGVNPLGGCLPMLLQMPVFIALYRMLATSFELRHAPFAGWINDLSAPDRLIDLPFSIPMIFFELDAVNLLPFLMAFAMYASMAFTPQSTAMNPQQQVMMRIMPFFFSVLCYNMASGLNLYILTSTVLGIAQNYVIRLVDIEVDVEKKAKKAGPAAAKPQHFYNRAQAKKRELAKEARKEKREKSIAEAKGKDRRP